MPRQPGAFYTDQPLMRRLAWTSVAAALIVVSACSDDDSKVYTAPPPVHKPADASPAFSRGSFCSQVLPDAEVARIAGQPMVRLPDAKTGSSLALVACRFASAGLDAGVDDPLEIHVVVDCRLPTSAAEQRRLVSNMGSGPDDEYRDSAIGGGGGVVMHQRFRSLFAAIAHKSLPCAIIAETRRASSDFVEPLAELVHNRLNSANRPRPSR